MPYEAVASLEVIHDQVGRFRTGRLARGGSSFLKATCQWKSLTGLHL
jgi:hypothetical protein